MDSNWRPIDSAPRDATDVLVTDGHRVYVAGWWQEPDEPDEDGEWTCYMDAIEDPRCPIEPTHWMPLPAPPAPPSPAAGVPFMKNLRFSLSDDFGEDRWTCSWPDFEAWRAKAVAALAEERYETDVLIAKPGRGRETLLSLRNALSALLRGDEGGGADGRA